MRTSTHENALKQLKLNDRINYVGQHRRDKGAKGGEDKRAKGVGRRGGGDFCIHPLVRERTYRKQPFFTFQVAPFVNHAWGPSMEYVRELMYAASDADDDASTPET